MLTIIGCTQCQKSGAFDIEFTFTPEHSVCKSCHHISESKWNYYFCNLNCFKDWWKENKIETKGFPCRDCINHETGKPSGFFAGFKVNGPCTTCRGKLRVLKSANKGLILKGMGN